MGRIWLPGGGGGGASSDDCTLMRAAVPAGMKAVTADSDDEAMEGTLNPDTTLAASQALSGQTYLKWNPQTKLFEKNTGSMPNKGAVNYSLPINGSYTIPAGFHNGSGKVSQSIPTKGAQTYTPGTTNQTIAANQYLTGPQTIKGDPNLRPENIKKGVSIMGIIGTHDGFVPGPMDIYNRGSWGSGYSSNNVVGDTDVATKFEASNILMTYSQSTTSFRGFSIFKNQPINLTPYKSFNMITTDASLGSNFRFRVVNTSGGQATYYTLPSSSNKQHTIDLTNINIVGWFDIDDFLETNNLNRQRHGYIYKMWFT